VYGELKLSEKLQLEIYTLRQEKENLREQVESLNLDQRQLQKLVKESALKATRAKVASQNLLGRIAKLEQEKTNLTMHLEKEQNHLLQLISLISVSEMSRKEFASKYQNEKIINEVIP